jgi:hypothetical protein
MSIVISEKYGMRISIVGALLFMISIVGAARADVVHTESIACKNGFRDAYTVIPVDHINGITAGW